MQQGADYVLAVKANQGKLHEDLTDLFDGAAEAAFQAVPHAHHHQVTKDHGRLKLLDRWVITAPEYLEFVQRHEAWKNLRSLIRIRTEVRRGCKRSAETLYFISSLQATPLEILGAIRGHWGHRTRLDLMPHNR